MQHIQSQIDNFKEKLTSQEYKNLCDSLMEMNTKQENSSKLYVITYLKPYMTKDSMYNIEFSCERKIVELSTQHYKSLKANLDNRGFGTINTSCGCHTDSKNWEHREVMFTMYKKVRLNHPDSDSDEDDSSEFVQVSTNVLVDQTIIGINPM